MSYVQLCVQADVNPSPIMCSLTCKAALSMIVLADDLQKVLRCEEKWSTVSMELSNIVESSNIASQLFGECLGAVLSEQLAKQIMEHIVRFFKDKNDITGEGFVKAI